MNSRHRGYLPHFESPDATYFLTFRLSDSLPADLLIRWKNEYEFRKRVQKDILKEADFLSSEYFSKIENYLDSGSGSCWLRDPRIASIVAKALRYFDGDRYHLHAWTIMPNHVHILFRPLETYCLSSIIHTWKSYTANQANSTLG